LKHDFFDKYSTLNSPVHCLDPRTKLITFFLAILIIVSEPRGELRHFAMYFLLIATILWITRIPVLFVFKRCLIASPFILISAILLPVSFAVGANPGLFRASEVNLIALSIVLKAFAAIVLITILTSTDRFHNYLAGLRRLKVPPVVGVISALMYRYIFLLIDEMHRTRRARESRTPGTLRTGRFSVYGNQAAMVFIRSWDRARIVYSSMLSRGFSGQFPEYNEFRIRPKDLIFGSLLLLVLVIIRIS